MPNFDMNRDNQYKAPTQYGVGDVNFMKSWMPQQLNNLSPYQTGLNYGNAPADYASRWGLKAPATTSPTTQTNQGTSGGMTYPGSTTYPTTPTQTTTTDIPYYNDPLNLGRMPQPGQATPTPGTAPTPPAGKLNYQDWYSQLAPKVAPSWGNDYSALYRDYIGQSVGTPDSSSGNPNAKLVSPAQNPNSTVDQHGMPYANYPQSAATGSNYQSTLQNPVAADPYAGFNALSLAYPGFNQQQLYNQFLTNPAGGSGQFQYGNTY